MNDDNDDNNDKNEVSDEKLQIRQKENHTKRQNIAINFFIP